MTTKHSTLIRLSAARRAYDAAAEACPHWDYENNSDGCCFDCCLALDRAKVELKHARHAHHATERSAA